MITPEMLRDKMNAKPFRPFRIDMKDGKFYWLPFRGSGLVKASSIEVGQDFDKHCIPCSTVHCAYSDIAQIEVAGDAKS